MDNTQTISPRYASTIRVTKGGQVHISGGNLTVHGPGRLHYSACGSTRGASCTVTTAPLSCDRCLAQV